MERIACKECTSPYCHGCNMYRLEQMLMSGKLDALMNENRTIKMDADVRPVARGKWIDHQEGRWVYAKCSECETVHDVRSNFCPNCGADMRGERDV